MTLLRLCPRRVLFPLGTPCRVPVEAALPFARISCGLVVGTDQEDGLPFQAATPSLKSLLGLATAAVVDDQPRPEQDDHSVQLKVEPVGRCAQRAGAAEPASRRTSRATFQDGAKAGGVAHS